MYKKKSTTSELEKSSNVKVKKKIVPHYCNQCGGLGWIYRQKFKKSAGQKVSNLSSETCPTCNGAGIVGN